jgi:hypothetical protein
MSSSCRSRAHRGSLTTAVGAVSVLTIALVSVASAQELYFVPRVEVGAEYHTNRELIPDPALQDAMIEYRGLFEARMGRITPRSEVELRPRVVLQEFPDRKGIDPVELFCDLKTGLHTQRSEFTLLARYDRQDSFNAEYGNANFDPFNPRDPNADDTGITYVGDTRQRITVEPDYFFAVSERTRVGATARYDNVNYYANKDKPIGTVGLIGYQSGSFQVYLGRSFGPKLDLQIGPYASRYEADDNSNQTDNYGLSLESKYLWSEIWESGLSLTAERSDSTQPQAIPPEDTTTNWGLEFYGLRKGQVDNLRYSIGHFIKPSSAATMIETNQLRVQYDHIFTPRLIFNSALRVKESSRLGSNSGNTSDFARAELSLRWRMTISWYVSGGYRYAWSDPSGDSGTASDNAVFVQFGYRGSQPEGRYRALEPEER